MISLSTLAQLPWGHSRCWILGLPLGRQVGVKKWTSLPPRLSCTLISNLLGQSERPAYQAETSMAGRESRKASRKCLSPTLCIADPSGWLVTSTGSPSCCRTGGATNRGQFPCYRPLRFTYSMIAPGSPATVLVAPESVCPSVSFWVVQLRSNVEGPSGPSVDIAKAVQNRQSDRIERLQAIHLLLLLAPVQQLKVGATNEVCAVHFVK